MFLLLGRILELAFFIFGIVMIIKIIKKLVNLITKKDSIKACRLKGKGVKFNHYRQYKISLAIKNLQTLKNEYYGDGVRIKNSEYKQLATKYFNTYDIEVAPSKQLLDLLSELVDSKE